MKPKNEMLFILLFTPYTTNLLEKTSNRSIEKRMWLKYSITQQWQKCRFHTIFNPIQWEAEEPMRVNIFQTIKHESLIRIDNKF